MSKSILSHARKIGIYNNTKEQLMALYPLLWGREDDYSGPDIALGWLGGTVDYYVGNDKSTKEEFDAVYNDYANRKENAQYLRDVLNDE